jgi:hypothetical protein
LLQSVVVLWQITNQITLSGTSCGSQNMIMAQSSSQTSSKCPLTAAAMAAFGAAGAATAAEALRGSNHVPMIPAMQSSST